MADEYITQAELQRRTRKSTLSPEDVAEFDQIREAVSRGADNYLGVPRGYFTPPDAPSTKRFYGDATNLIILPSPVFGEVTITAASGNTVPNFTVEDNRLITLSEDDYPNPFIVWGRVYYDITGSWGYAEIPPELKEACLQWANAIYRSNDNGLQGIVGGVKADGTIIERSIPASARLLLDNMLNASPLRVTAQDAPFIA